MATHSTIRMVLPSGKCSKVSYCHWNGDPDNMLPLLNENYNTIEKVEELISLGNLSYLAKKVKPDENETHSFDKPAANVTVAYHRDRGEDLGWTSGKEDYNYIFDGEKWNVI
jgi:hypothetical protein